MLIYIELAIVTQYTCLLGLALPVDILYTYGEPAKSWINCKDEALWLPYRRQSTVPSSVLYAVCLCVPCAVFGLCQCLISTSHTLKLRRLRQPVAVLTSVIAPKTLKMIPLVLSSLYYACYAFLLGAAASHLVTDAAKYGLGRPRPHFMQLCRPDVCLVAAAKMDIAIFENYICTNANVTDREIKEAKLSFMSGHSSLSAYAALFTSLYLVHRLGSHNHYRHFAFAITAACLSVATYVVYTRISDFKHHASDGIAGSLQGYATVFLTYRYYYYYPHAIFTCSTVSSAKKSSSSSSSEVGGVCGASCCGGGGVGSAGVGRGGNPVATAATAWSGGTSGGGGIAMASKATLDDDTSMPPKVIFV